MATVKNFSQTQRILFTDDWEAMRIIDETSPTAKLVAAKMREIVQRLLSKFPGQYNIDDFEFLVSDNESPNAFFMNDTLTRNSKNVIVVTTGMIDFCETEDEFASIIGHELGHYTYKRVFGDGTQNTVFQELGSDKQSIDLLVNGGYDPRAYQQIARRLFLQPKQSELEYVMRSVGVHGNEFSRVEYIEAYLTYIKKERGEFAITSTFDDGKWKVFQRQFAKVYPADKFKSYIDHTWGTQELTPDNFADFLDYAIGAMNSDNLDSKARLQDLHRKLFNFYANNISYEPTDAVRQKIHDLATAIISDEASQETVSVVTQLVYINKQKLKLVGRMVDFATDLQRFMAADNISDMTTIAKKWDEDVRSLVKYTTYFEPLPGFVMPRQEDAVGQVLPYAKHVQQAPRDFMQTVFNLPDLNPAANPMSPIRWPDDVKYEFTADVHGKITSVGQDVLDARATAVHNKFVEHLNVLTQLYDVYRGKMTGDEFWKLNEQNLAAQNALLGKIASYTYDTSVGKNKYWDIDAQSAVNSDVFKEMATVRTPGADSKFLDYLFSTSRDARFLENLLKMLLALIDTTTKNRVELLKTVYGIAQSCRWNIMEHSIEEAVKKISEKYTKLIQQRFVKVATPVEFFDNMRGFNIDKLVAEQYMRDRKMPELDSIFTKLDIAPPQSPDDFKNRINDMLQRRYPSGLIQHWVIRCLRQDLPIIDDLDTFLQLNIRFQPQQNTRTFRLSSRAGDFTTFSLVNGNKIAFATQNALAKYIRAHNLFPKNDFPVAFGLYKKMDSFNWFSKDESNQSECLSVLIENIKSMPPAARERYSCELLCGTLVESQNGMQKPIVRNSANKSITTFPIQETELMNIYADAIVARIGRDDGTPEYADKIKEIIAIIEARDTAHNGLFNNAEKSKFYRLLSDRVVSQLNVSNMLNTHATISNDDIESADDYGRAFEGFLAFLEQRQTLSRSTIEFLNRRLTPESIEQYKTMISAFDPTESTVEKYVNTAYLEYFYNSFWGEGLAFRSVIMNKLLNRISDKDSADEKIQEQIQYVCDMHFPTDSKYRKDAMLIFETAIMAFEPFERGLILAAIASADENKDADHQNATKSVGAGLRMFFENMGPAWVKFGQLLSYVPELPSEIRDDLGKLKDKADIPARWELFETIKTTLPNDLQKNIVQVDEILGAGSFWVTAKIQFVDPQTGVVQSKVLSLLRPHALNKTRAGFAVIEKAIGDLAAKNEKYKSLLKVASQARKSAEYEVDVVYGNAQFERAKKLYGDISVTIDDTEYRPIVSDWEYYGVGQNAVGYKLMDLAPGQTLARVNASAGERRKMALAYVTIELINLFKGNVWDIDRHMGQQNFETNPDGSVTINIYDTGAQMNRAPDVLDKMLLADVLYDLISAVRTGVPLDQQVLDTIKKLDNIEAKSKMNFGYVADVQKGLMALSDIMEYQKEIKDKDGNIIQPRLVLSASDLACAAEAAFESPTTDAWIKMTLAGRVMLNKLRPNRDNWVAAPTSKKTKNPVQVRIQKTDTTSHSIHMDKPASEIAENEHDALQEEILGINKKYIKTSTPPPSTTAELMSIAYARAS